MTNTQLRRVYLVRHGEAKPKNEDPERGLTEAGQAVVSRMAKWAAASGIRVDEIRHSGKLRAQQTADIFATALGVQPRTTPGLAPKDDVRSITEKLIGSKNNLMLVGHLPFLSRLASALLTGSPDSEILSFRYSCIVCLEHEEKTWRSCWIATPDSLP